MHVPQQTDLTRTNRTELEQIDSANKPRKCDSSISASIKASLFFMLINNKETFKSSIVHSLNNTSNDTNPQNYEALYKR